MGRNVFVSYKYSDTLVQDLGVYEVENWFGTSYTKRIATTARHYVDKIIEKLEHDDEHVYKGEHDGESMQALADTTISSKLGDKIFYSSVTIVLVSKGMKNHLLPESEQWMPWEISYSLKEQSRQGQNSNTNGVIAVILPDEMGSYEYYITRDSECNCRTLNTPFLFQILRDNMFNAKKPDRQLCNGTWVYSGDSSYIQSVIWEDFISNPTLYIEKAIVLRDNKDDFNLTKTIN
jgi:hypothetical protein